jgi:hypothetical protein
VNTYAWMGLAVVAVGAVLFFALLVVRLRQRRDPAQREGRQVIRDQETVNLARRMWMGGGE